jgi:hypothetical protein
MPTCKDCRAYIQFSEMEAGVCKSCLKLQSIVTLTASHSSDKKEHTDAKTVNSSTYVKICPFCAEEILALARKCKHCGSDLKQGALVDDGVKPAADYGVLLLSLPLFASILNMYWLGDPISALSQRLTTCITGLIACLEATKLGVKYDKKKRKVLFMSSALMILMWPLGYPLYLYKRKHFGLSNLLAMGLFVGTFFIGSSIFTNFAVEERKQKVEQEVNSYFDEVQRQIDSFDKEMERLFKEFWK